MESSGLDCLSLYIAEHRWPWHWAEDSAAPISYRYCSLPLLPSLMFVLCLCFSHNCGVWSVWHQHANRCQNVVPWGLRLSRRSHRLPRRHEEGHACELSSHAKLRFASLSKQVSDHRFHWVWLAGSFSWLITYVKLVPILHGSVCITI